MIGCGFAALGYEHDYSGPHMHALFQELDNLIKDFGITHAITGAMPGAETVWTYVADSRDLILTSVLATREMISHFTPKEILKMSEVEKMCTTTIVTSIGPYSAAKENSRDRALITMSEMVIFVWDKISKGRIIDSLAYAETLGKEIFLIDTKQLLK